MIHEPRARKPSVLRPLFTGYEFLVLGNGLDVLDVSADAGKFGREIEALARVRPLRVVDLVVGEVRNDFAGDDAVQRVRTRDAAEFQALEVQSEEAG